MIYIKNIANKIVTKVYMCNNYKGCLCGFFCVCGGL